jgi:outer membrane protein assembly factor BamB
MATGIEVEPMVGSTNDHWGGRGGCIAAIALTAALLGSSAAEATEWPQWRGSGRDAVSREAIGRKWPATLARSWRADVGSGQSSPVVSAGTVFLFTREGEEEVARALDLETGRLRWRQAYKAPHEVYPGAASFGGGPKSTPVIHEGRLFTLGISGILSAFDGTNGRVLWRKNFAGRFRETAPPFGTSMSPIVAAGMLIVHAGGHEGGALIAFDPATGKEKWVREGDGPSYSSPILTSFLGQEQIVIQVHRSVLGVEPTSGQVLWSLPFVTPCDQNIVTPLRAKDMLILSSLGQGTMAVRLTREGGKWSPKVAWQTSEVSMYMSSPVLVEGRVLGLSHRKRGQYFLLDPDTGMLQAASEGGRGESAAFVVAGDSVLVLEGDGRLLVLPAGPSRRSRPTEWRRPRRSPIPS